MCVDSGRLVALGAGMCSCCFAATARNIYHMVLWLLPIYLTLQLLPHNPPQHTRRQPQCNTSMPAGSRDPWVPGPHATCLSCGEQGSKSDEPQLTPQPAVVQQFAKGAMRSAMLVEVPSTNTAAKPTQRHPPQPPSNMGAAAAKTSCVRATCN